MPIHEALAKCSMRYFKYNHLTACQYIKCFQNAVWGYIKFKSNYSMGRYQVSSEYSMPIYIKHLQTVVMGNIKYNQITASQYIKHLQDVIWE